MLNKIQFIGHLGRDPEARYLPSGVAVSNFTVASTERWTDRNSGEKKEETEWLRCSAFDKLAEVCNQYLLKGSLVYVEGAMKTRRYTDKDGVEKYATECRLNSMRMLGGRPDAGQERAERQQPAARPAPQRAAAQQPATAGSGFDDMDDDIPF